MYVPTKQNQQKKNEELGRNSTNGQKVGETNDLK